jgi:hypothetical protein
MMEVVMADKHPYISSVGSIVQIIKQFRNTPPAKVDAPLFKKLGIAPNNESYLINILRYIGFIDEEGNKTEAAATTLSMHDDKSFHAEFQKHIKMAYRDLFATHGEAAWTLDENGLITFFRASDQSSAVIGERQARTFRTLSNLAGFEQVAISKAKSTKKAKTATAKAPTAKATQPQKAEERAKSPMPKDGNAKLMDLTLTVRVEVNLPANADQESYDRIFSSIRRNLIDKNIN